VTLDIRARLEISSGFLVLLFTLACRERRALWVDSREWIVDGKEGSLSTIYYPPSTKKALSRSNG
jgi:hypothetical protein